MNLILFILDFTIFLPITLIRLILIYFYGAKYSIEGFEFMDVLVHAENKYFNQTEDEFKVDTVSKDIRYAIYDSSKLTEKNIKEIEKIDEDTEEELIIKQTNNISVNKIKTIYDMLIEENNSRIFSDDLDEDMPDPNKKID